MYDTITLTLMHPELLLNNCQSAGQFKTDNYHIYGSKSGGIFQ